MTESKTGHLSLGLDIGGTHITAALIDIDGGQIIPESRANSRVNAGGTKDEIFRTWTETAKKTLGLLKTARFCGVGIAMPGPCDYEKGICYIEGVSKYENLYGVNICDEMRDRLELDSDITVIMRNDADCFLVGEIKAGAARGHKNVVGITLGTGFGSAFFHDGRLVENVPLEERFYCIPFEGGMADDFFSHRGLLNKYKQAAGTELSGVSELAKLAEEDDTAGKVFYQFGKNLAEAIRPSLAKHEPTCLVVGGNISKAWDFFSDSLISGLAGHYKGMKIVQSELFDDAAILGAGFLPVKEGRKDID